MANNTKLAALYSSDDQKICVAAEDSCVIEMDNFSSHPNNKNITQDANSRITLQRSLSRKGSQRMVTEKKSNGITTSPNELFSKGSSTPDKASSVGPADTGSNQSSQVHHQITVTTTGYFTAASTATENRFGLRRNSFKRSGSSSWGIDPKKVLLFFATLSSMGTILLIYFTLAIGKFNVDNQPLD